MDMPITAGSCLPGSLDHAHTLTAHAVSTALRWDRTCWCVTKTTSSTQGCCGTCWPGILSAGEPPLLLEHTAPTPLAPGSPTPLRLERSGHWAGVALAHAPTRPTSHVPPPLTAPQCSAPEARMAAGDRRRATDDWGERLPSAPSGGVMRHQVVRPAAPVGEGREPPGAAAALLPSWPLSSQSGTRSAGALQPPLRPGRTGLAIGCDSCQSCARTNRKQAGVARPRDRRRGSGSAQFGSARLHAHGTRSAGWRQGPACSPPHPGGSPSEALRGFVQGVCQTQVHVSSFTDRCILF